MKQKLLMLLFCFSCIQLRAQPVSYTIDSTSFNALTLDGGVVEVEFADINQNGHPDIISIGDHGSPFINTNQHGITVFFGNGTGTGWQLYQTGDFGYGGIAAGDINNDGFMDVAYSMHHNYSSTDFGDQLIEAALGDGTGMNWTTWDDSLATNGETYGMMGTDLGDVDNDGLLDIGSNSFGCCAGVHIYKNHGTGVWSQTFGFVNGNTGHYMQFGDINHDGNLDFVVCNQYGAAYFGDGAGNFTLHQNNLPPLGNIGYGDVSLSDIDNDGDDDFAFISNGAPYVYKWNNATQQWINCSAGLSGANGSIARLTDVNMDGFADLVHLSSGELKIWTGNGGTLWSNVMNYALPGMTGCYDITVGDIDHNGKPDILTWATYNVSLFIYESKLKLFKETSIPAALDITMLYPIQYECFPNNAERFIRWYCAVPGNHASSVSIELSTTGSSGPWTLIEAALPNNGKYQWTVPATGASSNCFFRFIATDSVTLAKDTAINTNPFQIGICNPTLGETEINSPVNDFTVFPNPLQETTTLFSSKRNCLITVTDVAGKIVQPVLKVKQFPYLLNCKKLHAGIYFLQMKDEDGNIFYLKLNKTL